MTEDQIKRQIAINVEAVRIHATRADVFADLGVFSSIMSELTKVERYTKLVKGNLNELHYKKRG